MQPITINDVLKASERIIYGSRRIMGNPVEVTYVIGTDYHELEPVAFDPIQPGRVASLNGLDIFIDEHITVPRMRVSDAFRRIQTPKLVSETQKWMTEFFGFEEYPMLFVGKLLVMPTKTLVHLRDILRGQV